LPAVASNSFCCLDDNGNDNDESTCNNNTDDDKASADDTRADADDDNDDVETDTNSCADAVCLCFVRSDVSRLVRTCLCRACWRIQVVFMLCS
jgi:hypothetical protein